MRLGTSAGVADTATSITPKPARRATCRQALREQATQRNATRGKARERHAPRFHLRVCYLCCLHANACEPERAGAVGRGRSGCAERWFGPPTGRSGGRGTHSSARCRAVRIASLGGDTVPPWDAVPPWDTVPHGAGGCLACGTHCRRGIPAAMRSRSRSVETSAGRRSHSYLRTIRTGAECSYVHAYAAIHETRAVQHCC
jgi:hypothetical protein